MKKIHGFPGIGTAGNDGNIGKTGTSNFFEEEFGEYDLTNIKDEKIKNILNDKPNNSFLYNKKFFKYYKNDKGKIISLFNYKLNEEYFKPVIINSNIESFETYDEEYNNESDLNNKSILYSNYKGIFIDKNITNNIVKNDSKINIIGIEDFLTLSFNDKNSKKLNIQYIIDEKYDLNNKYFYFNNSSNEDITVVNAPIYVKDSVRNNFTTFYNEPFIKVSKKNYYYYFDPCTGERYNPVTGEKTNNFNVDFKIEIEDDRVDKKILENSSISIIYCIDYRNPDEKKFGIFSEEKIIKSYNDAIDSNTLNATFLQCLPGFGEDDYYNHYIYCRFCYINEDTNDKIQFIKKIDSFENQDVNSPIKIIKQKTIVS